MKKLLTGALVVLVVASIFFAVISFLGTSDTRIFDDDLHIKRLDLPLENNACTYFLAATNTLFLPYEVHSKIIDSIKSNIWNESVISGILATNETTLSTLEHGLKCSSCECPSITNREQSLSYLSSWRSMARLMSLKTKWLFHSGKHEEALENAERTIKFGNMIEQGSENLIQWLVGVAVKGIGLSDLEEMIGPCTLSSEKLRMHAELLANYNAAEKGLQNAFKGEYKMACGTVDDVVNGKISLKEILSLSMGAKQLNDNRQKYRLHIPSYVLHSERTKIMFAETYRSYINEVCKTYADSNKKLLKRDDISSTSSGIMQIVLPNGVGRLFHRMMTSYIGSTLEKKCRDNVHVSGLSVLMALKAFKQDNNRLPESLAELTPSYLKIIPRDPYDGEFLRYSMENKKIYSIGKDLKDGGGSEVNPLPASPYSFMKDKWNTEDIVFKIDF